MIFNPAFKRQGSVELIILLAQRLQMSTTILGKASINTVRIETAKLIPEAATRYFATLYQ